MPYLTVPRLGKLCRRLGGFALGLGERVAAAAAEPFRHRLAAGREVPDLLEYQLLVGDKLQVMYAELVAWNDRLSQELARGGRLRDLRQGFFAELRRELSRVTDVLVGAWEASTIQGILRQVRPLPEDPRRLHRLALRFRALLTDSDLELPPSHPGFEIDLVVLGNAFEVPMERLGETLAELSAHEAELSHLRSRKNEAQERLRSYAEKVGRFYVALYELADQPRQAEQVRAALRGKSK